MSSTLRMCCGRPFARLTSCVPYVPIRRAIAALAANGTRVVATDRIAFGPPPARPDGGYRIGEDQSGGNGDQSKAPPGPFPQGRQSPTKSLAPHHCWLTNKIKAPAVINTASGIPATSETTQCRLGLTSFDPFCAAPRPNQKRSLSIAVSAVIGAALWQCTYDYVELSHSASAKSPNPGQGCLARRHHER